MKKTIVLTYIILICSVSLNAKPLAGYIVFDDSIRIAATLDIPFDINKDVKYISLQKKVKYKVSNKWLTINPTQAIEFAFIQDSDTIRMIAIEKGKNYSIPTRKNTFLRLEEDGDIRLFRYYTPNVNMYGSPFKQNIEHIYEKDKGELVTNSELFSSENYFSIFFDCPLLISAYKNDEFRVNDFSLIVRYYNEKCN